MCGITLEGVGSLHFMTSQRAAKLSEKQSKVKRASERWTFLTPGEFAGRKETSMGSLRSHLRGQMGAGRVLSPVDPAGAVFLSARRKRRFAARGMWMTGMTGEARLEGRARGLSLTLFSFPPSLPAAAGSSFHLRLLLLPRHGSGPDELLCPRTSWALIFLADHC